MGCGSSRSVSTIEPSPVRGRLVKDSTSSVKPSKGVPNNNSRISIPTDKNNESESYGHSHSCTNVNNISTKRREISATSTRTADSGISESEDGEILTENSNPSKLNQVRASERPITPELTLEGRACPRLQSGKEKRQSELRKKNSESTIPRLPSHDDGSPLQRPKTRGGVAFDVMLCPETGNIKKAPPNLPKLERRKRGKKLTKEELEEKMRKATERRKEHEKKIVEKSQAFIAQYGHFGHTNPGNDNTNSEQNQESRVKVES